VGLAEGWVAVLVAGRGADWVEEVAGLAEVEERDLEAEGSVEVEEAVYLVEAEATEPVLGRLSHTLPDCFCSR